MISNLIPLLVLIAGAAFAAALLWRYPTQASLVALGAAIGLDCLQVGISGINLGVTFYPDDIACLLLLSAGVVVFLQRQQLPECSCWPVLTLLALTGLDFARGAIEFGIKPAGNGARPLAYLIIPSISLLLLRPALQLNPQRIARWLCGFGSALVILALTRWAGLLPTPPELIDSSDFREVVRVLPAANAMIIAQGLLAILFLQLERGIRSWGIVLTGMLACAAVALQHRSVWLSALVGLIWFAARTLRASKVWRQLAIMALIALTMGATTLAVAGRMDRLWALGTVNFEETRRNDSTWEWRVQGYAEAMDRLFSADIIEILVGPPSGRNLTSEDDSDADWDASYASVHIHSRYVATLAYYGMVGVVSLIAWFAIVAYKVGGWARPIRDEGWSGKVFLQALLVSQLTYFIAYSGELMQGGVIALLWLASDLHYAPSSKKILSAPLFTYTPNSV